MKKLFLAAVVIFMVPLCVMATGEETKTVCGMIQHLVSRVDNLERNVVNRLDTMDNRLSVLEKDVTALKITIGSFDATEEDIEENQEAYPPFVKDLEKRFITHELNEQLDKLNIEEGIDEIKHGKVMVVEMRGNPKFYKGEFIGYDYALCPSDKKRPYIVSKSMGEDFIHRGYAQRIDTT